jgi:hypothetical protein
MTKFPDGLKITGMIIKIGFQFVSGRSGLALKAALDIG